MINYDNIDTDIKDNIENNGDGDNYNDSSCSDNNVHSDINNDNSDNDDDHNANWYKKIYVPIRDICINIITNEVDYAMSMIKMIIMILVRMVITVVTATKLAMRIMK